MEKPWNQSDKAIKKEQHALLYEQLIDDGCDLYRGYKVIHCHLGTHITKSIAQDLMLLKLTQCKAVMRMYHELSSEKYMSKKINIRGEYWLTEMFALESKYAESLNHLYANTMVSEKQFQIMQLINSENLLLFQLLYLQRLVGINWKADNK
ncbi:hypothetical protein HZI73_02790 [Vallitalea pronyensis]|uniref:Uncharacterized protein n=1 Tax=Vallitalea pronyensis TaxID=1348613 RepID=A0A8J8MGQ0_9FIRM|nr:hypothetical protein [Vallitalea pronyensis]QUI21274.1 hypothetical protein HZI73_02790 [Vallitalea pronyensis]